MTIVAALLVPGSPLPQVARDNPPWGALAKAYEAASKGDKFCGEVDVLGTKLDSCYHPIKDAGGKVVGLTYVGYKK